MDGGDKMVIIMIPFQKLLRESSKRWCELVTHQIFLISCRLFLFPILMIIINKKLYITDDHRTDHKNPILIFLSNVDDDTDGDGVCEIWSGILLRYLSLLFILFASHSSHRHLIEFSSIFRFSDPVL